MLINLSDQIQQIQRVTAKTEDFEHFFVNLSFDIKEKNILHDLSTIFLLFYVSRFALERMLLYNLIMWCLLFMELYSLSEMRESSVLRVLDSPVPISAGLTILKAMRKTIPSTMIHCRFFPFTAYA